MFSLCSDVKDGAALRERRLALLHVLGLGAGSGLPAEVDGDAHEEAALVEEVAGDVDAHQQQEEHHDEDAHDGPRSQAGAAARGVWWGGGGGGCKRGTHEHDKARKDGEEEEELGKRGGGLG